MDPPPPQGLTLKSNRLRKVCLIARLKSYTSQAGRHAHQNILRRMDAQIDPAESDQKHNDCQNNPQGPRNIFPYDAASEYGGGVHGVAAWKRPTT